jgi:hypothetical protein
MSDTNLAQEATGGDEALSVQDGADAISDLLKDPVTDPKEEDQAQEGDPEETETTEGDEPEEGEGTEDADAEIDETVDGEGEDGSGESSGGRFVSKDAKFTLDDGTVISVGELARNNLYQRDYTRKTQELSEERKTLEQTRAQTDQTAQALKQERDFLLQVAQQFAPQMPDESLLDQNSPNYDPIRYMGQKADYDKRVGALNQLQYASQAEQARMAQEQQNQQKELRSKEAKKLLETMPELKKPEVYRKFWSEAVDTMAEYGFTEAELNDAMDHRNYKVFRDLAAYRRARKKAPAVKETMQSKPVLSGKRRMDPKAKNSRDKQVRQEQLRKTGTFDAGVSALMDLDL